MEEEEVEEEVNFTWLPLCRQPEPDVYTHSLYTTRISSHNTKKKLLKRERVSANPLFKTDTGSVIPAQRKNKKVIPMVYQNQQKIPLADEETDSAQTPKGATVSLCVAPHIYMIYVLKM
mmetsp:Transcript_14336/g.16398  ORF Transcript_14336/g.16398 Transcript_14336/m.16398 type:complete len:119 (+) Transcript_14336:729-1085(+)